MPSPPPSLLALRIPEDKIEEIRAATDILPLVQQYVALKKKGANWFGLCPFHTENTPSFSVNPGRGIYKCFGCGRGGNAIGFLIDVERISYIEAVRMLAERAGIALPAPSEADRDADSESERLVRANGLARDFFHRQLTESRTDLAEEARAYLTNRGYTKAIIDRFLLGYAPDAWDSLAEFARSSGLPLSVFVQAGLLKEGKERNRPYDAFRHRIIFPIRNLAGRVIAFGGRKLREDDSAKYINSPETAVYHKGRELFGLWEARDLIRKQDEAILVEGYTDCLSLVVAGVTVTVATLGTALTEQQARLLKRFTSRVFILYDGDSAGLNAARRAVDVLMEAGVRPAVLMLPEGEDPDSFVRKHGGEAVWKLRNEHALSAVDFQLKLTARAKTSVSEAAKDLIATAALIGSPVDQDVFLQEISDKTRISLDALRRELARVRPTPKANREMMPTREKWPPPGPAAVLAKVLIRQPQLRPEVFAQWKPNGLNDPRLSTFMNHLYGEWERSEVSDATVLLDHFPESPVREFIVDSMYETQTEEDEDKLIAIDRQIIQDCLSALEADQLHTRIAELKRQLATDSDAQLLTELQQLVKQEKDLRARGK
ncbi:MAG: DNA primase [Calditrichota bacterium]